MKTTKTITLAVLPVIAVMLVLSPTVMAATSTSTPLSLMEQGIITNAGMQTYSIQGGILVGGSFAGQPATPGPVAYSVNARVAGLGTSGSASLSFAAGSLAVNANIVINGEISAGAFPLNINTGQCTNGCHSQIPLMFTGIATIKGLGHPIILPVAIESAYWNPFGGPIVITSLDSSTAPTLFLVVTYNAATINWTRVQLQGYAAGMLGSNPVFGYYTTITNSYEDLAAGVEQDSGQLAFSGMSIASLNGQGTLTGSTTIPAEILSGPGANSFDCTSPYALALGFVWPFGPGTCTLTGANSGGNFQMRGSSGATIAGSYVTGWSVPSLQTQTTVTASVTQ